MLLELYSHKLKVINFFFGFLQNSLGSSSFAELLSAPYPEEVNASLPDDLDPFHDVVTPPPPPPHTTWWIKTESAAGPHPPVPPEQSTLPSFQETYASLGFKMEDECYVGGGYHHPEAAHSPTAAHYTAEHHYAAAPNAHQGHPQSYNNCYHHGGYYQPPQSAHSPQQLPPHPAYHATAATAAAAPPPPQLGAHHHDSYSLPHFPSGAELSVNTGLGPRQRRASLPLQRSESTR